MSTRKLTEEIQPRATSFSIVKGFRIFSSKQLVSVQPSSAEERPEMRVKPRSDAS